MPSCAFGAESVAELAGVNVPYTPRANSNGSDTTTTKRNSVNIQDLVLDAQTLYMSGTYGLNVDCTTQNQGSLYKTEIKATSDCEKKFDVATVTVTFAVNEARVLPGWNTEMEKSISPTPVIGEKEGLRRVGHSTPGA